MQHPGKAAIAGVPSPPLPLVDLPTGSPEAKASLQVEQELKSRRGRPLSRIRDEQLQGANDSRGEVAWGYVLSMCQSRQHEASDRQWAPTMGANRDGRAKRSSDRWMQANSTAYRYTENHC